MTLLFFSCLLLGCQSWLYCRLTLSRFLLDSDGAHKEPTYQNKLGSLTQLKHTQTRSTKTHQSAVYRFQTEVVCGRVSSFACQLTSCGMDAACRLVTELFCFGLFPYRAHHHRRQNPTWQRS